jgi:hypothetical protein
MTSENADNPVGPEQSAVDANAKAADHYDKPDPPIPPAVIVTNPPPPPQKHCEITVNTKRDRVDWWTLRLEGFGLFVLVVYTIFTGLMYFANRNAANAAKSAADTAQKSLELVDRAWIKITDVTPLEGHPNLPTLLFMPFAGTGKNWPGGTPPKQQAYLGYRVIGQNVGHSPALNIELFAELYLPQWGDSYSPQLEEKRFCELVTKDKKNMSDGGRAIFPEDPYRDGGGISNVITQDSINFSTDLPGGPYVLPVLIGCVDYQFQSSIRHHQTRFVCEVFHAAAPKTRFFLVGQEVKPADLLFIRNTEDDYAD